MFKTNCSAYRKLTNEGNEKHYCYHKEKGKDEITECPKVCYSFVRNGEGVSRWYLDMVHENGPLPIANVDNLPTYKSPGYSELEAENAKLKKYIKELEEKDV